MGLIVTGRRPRVAICHLRFVGAVNVSWLVAWGTLVEKSNTDEDKKAMARKPWREADPRCLPHLRRAPFLPSSTLVLFTRFGRPSVQMTT
jgi:hypothetical protein